MGLGSFPREFYVAQAGPLKLPAYRLEREVEGDRAYLRVAGGGGLFIDPRVSAAPGRELRLRGHLRSSHEGAKLGIALCEKSFLSSVRCNWSRVAAATGWQPFEARLSLPAAANTHIGLRAPLSISLHNDEFGTRIDVTDLSLTDGSIELLANGSFDRGLDLWLVFSDVHLAWRALNTPVQVIFEQGLFGAVAWVAIGLSLHGRRSRTLQRLVRRLHAVFSTLLLPSTDHNPPEA